MRRALSFGTLVAPSVWTARRTIATPGRMSNLAAPARAGTLPAMRLVRHADAARFLAAAEPTLARNEGYFQLPLGIARTCVADPGRYPGPNYFVTLETDGRVAGCATMTPPYRLLLYVPPGAGQELVAADLALGAFPVSGVNAPVANADAFASLWCSPRGLRARLHQDLRAFELTVVVAAPPVDGGMRVAAAGDLPFVEAAYRDFYVEANMPSGNLPPEEIGRRAVREGRAFLWDDGGPVAQAVIVGHTATGSRIGAVYSPPPNRRRGYATALMEHLSRHVLASGKRSCFLFTDLANPVSNSIYPKVGYRPVADFRDVEFVAKP